MSRVKPLIAIALGLAVAGGAAQAEDGNGRYWVSLRKSESNMRVGPGREYRISWVYIRPGLPMKVLREMGGWALVEDPDGVRGWMLQQFITSKVHTGVVKGQVAEIRENKDGSGRLLWRAAPGVVAKIKDCDDGWCKVDVDGRQGFMNQAAMWGAGAP
ncbi:SH3 domain-containing protein [Novosphingobium cyanobacteriorum]|uniref:SH3 domain-containing protein n=1 Tax=Novosphingobium cyanobacteriorum TaxID=3024215 RepID=A0ABT6CCE4_9SPHN|nr:SH3 domain-containing protein [Novosphingobium cyanobacteriorum]MDF8331601.1 SH3 domain-containing protein [Novosphingobium cyanobacteriorum]